MIEILQESQGNVLAVQGRGTLSDADYDHLLIPTLENIMKEHRKARLLFDMSRGFRGWNIAAAWRYAKFGLKHRSDFEKVAAICGPKWVQMGMKMQALVSGGETKTFSCDERSEAFDWIRA
ncbi:MAG: STAS/SEC14 domain-containing protein [Thermodesulfobacteriota bacterium]